MNGPTRKGPVRAVKRQPLRDTASENVSRIKEAKIKKKEVKTVVPEDSEAGNSAGSESKEAVDPNCAPEEAVKEEERLRKEREDANKEALQGILKTEEGRVLSDAQFAQLDGLIERTNAYSQFLCEQMFANENIEGEGDAITGEKRKASGLARVANKRAKAQSRASQSETQAFLPLVKGELRDYQLKGVRWMASLYQNGLNGILADQMGLGKTVQTIGFLSHLYSKGIKGPFLIIGPLSTLPNWMSEVERFCPILKAVLYHGSKQERADIRNKKLKLGRQGSKGYSVIVTSFEIVMADIKALQNVYWKYIIVDEGHRLKNWNCKLLRELKTLETANKLILSGTPLQNNLSELWSLLNFLLPEIFTSMSTFESWFDFSGISDEGGSQVIAAQQQRNQVVSKLHSLLRPFLLRRIKADVESSLPAKKEIILYAHMTDNQKEFNEQLRTRTLNEVLARKEKEEGGRKSTTAKLNNMIMQMRKNCNHPDLISAAFTTDVYFPEASVLLEQCGKLQLLNRLLIQLKAKRHKVLIFSQMTKMLDILDTFLEQEGHRSCRLDGSVKWQDRQQAMQDFTADPDLFCFLLSTRAGGLGINLTAADTVIIYDSDWNPHQDMQAMDRAHRIGQNKPVLVLRLATANSVEGRMLKRANSKLMLERLVIRQGAFLPAAAESQENATSLSTEELLEMLKDTMPLKDEPQSGVVTDAVLKKLLDRSHMETGQKAPYKDAGVGYEVVQSIEGHGVLSTVQ